MSLDQSRFACLEADEDGKSIPKCVLDHPPILAFAGHEVKPINAVKTASD
jgi:hypothetical protein